TAGSFGEQFLQLRGLKLGRELVERALLRLLVGPPAQKAGAVAEAAAGNLVVADLCHEHWSQRLEMAGALGVPAARASGRSASEARRLDESLQVPGQLRPLCRRDRGGKADMIEQSLIIVESKKQRADLRLLLGI